MKKTLNNPGESTERRRWDLLVENGLLPFVVATFAVIAAAQEWLFKLLGSRPHPWVWTVTAIGAVLFAVMRVRRMRGSVHNLVRGVQGEKEVAEVLDELKSRGYRVFHDLEGDGFNVDHVLVGPTGVFAIETKFRTKPEGQNPTVAYDGQHILVNGHRPDRDPVVQARASAHYVSKRMRDVVGEHVSVRSVVLFPGWWVSEQPNAEVWVLNPMRLLGYLRQERERLSLEQVRRLAAIVSDFAKVSATK